MKNNTFTQLMRGIMLGALVLAFSSCEDDNEPIYYSYGMVTTPGENLGGTFGITLDNGHLVNPKEFSSNLAKLNDSTRVHFAFNILSEQDSSTDVRILRADTILTKAVLAYDESILDSIGHDPVRITHPWFAHGFLNLKFTYAGRYNISLDSRHMVNLLQHPSEDGKIIFDFRHNAFDDRKETVHEGIVSFPISKILADLEKPVTITVKYKDSSSSERSLELEYK